MSRQARSNQFTQFTQFTAPGPRDGRGRRRPKTAAAALLAAGAIAAGTIAEPPPGSAGAGAGGDIVTETGLGPEPFFSTKGDGADFLAAGTTTRGSIQLEPFALPVPPTPGLPVATFISWAYLLNGDPPDSDTILVNGETVFGTLCGRGTPDLAWGKEGAATYLAEVPDDLVLAGDNQIAGATDKPLGADPGALGEGLSILRVYRVPGAKRRSVDVYCGYASNTSGPGAPATAQVELAFTQAYLGGGAHLFLNALDGQVFEDRFLIGGESAGGIVAGTGSASNAWTGILGPLDFGNLYDHADDTIGGDFIAPAATSLVARTEIDADAGDTIGHSFAAVSFECDLKNLVAKWRQLPHNFPSDCCFPHDGLGCNVDACTDLVCEIDPFCCEVQWDQICADEAADLCADVCTDEPLGFNAASDLDWRAMGPPCNCDANQDGACDITDLAIIIDCVGQPPGPDCPDMNCDGTIDDDDVAVWECLFQGGSPEACCPGCQPPAPPPCNCDANQDGACDVTDLAIILNCFGQPPGPGCPDLNCDGAIDDGDVAVWECLFDGGSPDECCPDCAPPPPCSCDVNGDGGCDVNDITQLAGCVGSPPGPGCPDLDCDGVISEQDLVVLECLFAGGPPETCCPACVDPAPNRAVADDFVSDGRPITCVRWWGSYVDPAFEPLTGGPGCDCDTNGDGNCDINDLTQILLCFGPIGPGCEGSDINCDGIIDDGDIETFICLFEGEGSSEACCITCTSDRRFDGWLLSFHTDLPAQDNPDGFSRPLDLLGLYYCEADRASIKPTELVGWDGHRVFEYVAELRDCCLIHTHLDSRVDRFPAHPCRFRETDGLVYWLDIQAVVGHAVEPNNTRVEPICDTCECDLDGNGQCNIDDLVQLIGCIGDPACDINCDGVSDGDDVEAWLCLNDGIPGEYCCVTDEPVCVERDTDNAADEHFWGWHTSPDEWNDQSTAGRVMMGPDGDWVYGSWFPVDGSPHELPLVDQAFELLTPACPGDVTGDRTVSVEDLIAIVLAWDSDDEFADVNCDGIVNVEDLIEVVLHWGDCPE